METERFEYVIDANDVIREVNDGWRKFADLNGSPALGNGAVGTWLWQHLAGLEVKHLYRTLLDRVREGRGAVRVPFRCDAPELRRHMILEVTPLADGAVRFSSWVVEEEGRSRVHLLDPGREQDLDRFLRMCAWCKRVDAGGDDWREMEDALAQGEIFGLEPLPQITHAVCPDCRRLVLRELEEVRQGERNPGNR